MSLIILDSEEEEPGPPPEIPEYWNAMTGQSGMTGGGQINQLN
jgi:hypothetical protein